MRGHRIQQLEAARKEAKPEVAPEPEAPDPNRVVVSPGGHQEMMPHVGARAVDPNKPKDDDSLAECHSCRRMMKDCRPYNPNGDADWSVKWQMCSKCLVSHKSDGSLQGASDFNGE